MIVMNFDSIRKLAAIPVPGEVGILHGLESLVKVFNKAGQPAFLSKCKLELDTDGKRNPEITHYDVDHQDTTSLGHWVQSDKICYIVLPGGFGLRHDGFQIGMLATVCYKGKIVHAIVADVGPKAKFGEGSIMLHEAIDGSRVKKGRILNIGIDGGVEILWYLGSKINGTPCSQADVNNQAAPLFASYAG